MWNVWKRLKKNGFEYQTVHFAPGSSEIDKFLTLAVCSGVVTVTKLWGSCTDFDIERTDDIGLNDLCNHLISKGALTKWQCDKLRQGKWKGFWIDDFCLLSQTGKTDKASIYLAQEWPSARRVSLSITPPMNAQWAEGRPVYEVEENVAADESI